MPKTRTADFADCSSRCHNTRARVPVQLAHCASGTGTGQMYFLLGNHQIYGYLEHTELDGLDSTQVDWTRANSWITKAPASKCRNIQKILF